MCASPFAPPALSARPARRLSARRASPRRALAAELRGASRTSGADSRTLESRITVASAGDALLSPSVTRRLIGEFATRAKEPALGPELDRLTEREREVMGLVAAGLTNEEIAEKLFLSPATAKTHVSRAMVKLGARDRAQLVVFAYESGLVRPGWSG